MEDEEYPMMKEGGALLVLYFHGFTPVAIFCRSY
jgi:hypothetical protein